MNRPSHPFEKLSSRAQSNPDSVHALHVNWGAQVGPHAEIPPKLRKLQPHFLIQGMTGSGKTTVMKMLMHSILPDQLASAREKYDLTYRALIYDAKNDLLPFLYRMGLTEKRQVILTNPFDRRSSAWDVAADVTNAADAESFAAIIVTSEESSSDQFWEFAAREVVAGVIHGLIAAAPGNWGLRDLVHIAADDHLLEQILQKSSPGQRVIARYLKADTRLSGSVLATLQRHVAPYRLIAALWERADTTFNFRAWRNRSGVILVGNHYRHTDAIARVNNLLVRSAVEAVMDLPDEEEDDLTFFFLDELRYAGRFPGFAQLLNQGRSKGARAVLAVQGMSGLKLVFGENGAGEVANACGNKCILQLADPQDAEWASRLFATTLGHRKSLTNAPDGKQSTTISEADLNAVQPAEFMNMPNAHDNGGAITGYYHHPGGYFMKRHIPADRVDSAMPPLFTSNAPAAFLPRFESDYELALFGDEDYSRLSLRPATDSPARAEKSVSNIRPFVMPSPHKPE